MFDKGGKGTGVCEREEGQGKVPGIALNRLTHIPQEAEQVAYANTQIAAAQTATTAFTQDAQPAVGLTTVADTGAMDIDEAAAAQESAGETHGGVKRKAGEDAVPTAKKLRMGMFMTPFRTSAFDHNHL